jgi:hypothetical protein
MGSTDHWRASFRRAGDEIATGLVEDQNQSVARMGQSFPRLLPWDKRVGVSGGPPLLPEWCDSFTGVYRWLRSKTRLRTGYYRCGPPGLLDLVAALSRDEQFPKLQCHSVGKSEESNYRVCDILKT